MLPQNKPRWRRARRPMIVLLVLLMALLLRWLLLPDLEDAE